MVQADFAAEFLEKNKTNGIHTAIETTMYAEWETVKKVAEQCNLVFCDMKFFDAELHKKWTGVDNTIIKENILKFKYELPDVELIVRTPVIPGINDNEELERIVNFLKQVPNLTDYELLPFHNYGSIKYKQLAMKYNFSDVAVPEKKEIKRLNNLFRKKLGLIEK